jgi:hypothetical protein
VFECVQGKVISDIQILTYRIEYYLVGIKKSK